MTPEQRRDFLREQVEEWQSFGDICVNDIDVAVNILVKGYLRTLERLPGNDGVPLDIWCDTFHRILMEQPEQVRKMYWVKRA